MAYTLTDQFRALRMTMRLNGLVIGLALGLLCLLSPKTSLSAWGLYTSGALWPLRATGAVLLALGLLYVLAASQDTISMPLLLSMVIVNSLLAIVLLFAYLQQELAGLTLIGQLLLIAIFLLCLIGAVVPLRYFRLEYRPL
ncbi:hypothetical protein BH10CHL1_BH10CHL1_09370 [soil metagenome]